MSKIRITDIPVFADISIDQQKIIVGGTTTAIGTNPVPNYIPLNPIINNFLTSLDINAFDWKPYLDSVGFDISLPMIT
ncbi:MULTISPECIES: hypothetical protein [Nostocales]|jgi:hypothetical protein|uniref:Uncharacterized protein n=2 Tax=Aphanizomenonaceae TaxID=1892259 RepID=A0ACC7SAS9_DOLFA|nr:MULTISPECIES: hypothetical protein [Nostocales]MBO1068172.1 hypothetical protein [Dolichospermum sp. DEX189]MCX5981151.1 hypothetical protein [Nostocales cyanobacterium LacPavin_0920_SED1_MAG_38_18]ALB41300.1 hypothetical protein AA650_13275 [Anabaena sp. WA102]MBD2280691.1 hypothetical protein [Aphanizomenon flos-aquae FACHB-1040]MBO1065086.1 hypothetical protein [Anabaena sp. 54]